MKALLIIVGLSCMNVGNFAFADAKNSDVELVIKYFPKSISELKNGLGDKATLENGLSYSFVVFPAKGTQFKKIIPTIYRANIGDTYVHCELHTILVGSKNDVSIVKTQTSVEDGVNDCEKTILKDLDGDGVPELLISTSDPYGQHGEQFVFKWEKSKFVDITPTKKSSTGDVINAFRSVKFEDLESGGSTLVIDSPAIYYLHGQEMGRNEDRSYKIYFLKKGKFEVDESWDFLKIVRKNDGGRSNIQTFKVDLIESTYTLEMKNLSPHKHAVRAEVSVNGDIVLAPKDFCTSPTPPNSTLAKLSVNEADEDKNEDNMRHCSPKKDIFAIVNMKKENVIKVKMYGPKSSVFQLSLVKKP